MLDTRRADPREHSVSGSIFIAGRHARSGDNFHDLVKLIGVQVMSDEQPSKWKDHTRRLIQTDHGRTFSYYSLPALHALTGKPLQRLPVSLRIMIESLLRNMDGLRARESHLQAMLDWQPKASRIDEVPFLPARIIAPDSSGIPMLADLAAMRDAVSEAGFDPQHIRPLLPVDLIIDHSVQVDHYGQADALDLNLRLEYERNQERYALIKWAGNALAPLRVFPPGTGIIHQVNLENWSPGLIERDGVLFPDTVIGADSHTAMINGIGVLGWGAGGIEVEAAMLGQPVMLLMPDVIGVELRGRLKKGVTATDAVLTIVERLRAEAVVDQFVEFHGEGAAQLSAPNRATIANMAPEYGATAAFFPVDEATLAYYLATGRNKAWIELMRHYYQAQEMFGMPRAGDCIYTRVIVVNLDDVTPSVAGPGRPQDRISLSVLPRRFDELLYESRESGGFGLQRDALPDASKNERTGTMHGDIVLAAITSCTNTSNPELMIGAGLLARNAVSRGLQIRKGIKTSLAPGSRVVSAYLNNLGLQTALDHLGFQVVGYGCTTCVGNGGKLPIAVETQIQDQNLVVCAVLSGNRNFEARIHPAIRANFLMSPALVVAFALAGRIDIDFTREALGTDKRGMPVYLHDIWPNNEEIESLLPATRDPALFEQAYKGQRQDARWDKIDAACGQQFNWDKNSTYLKRPPFFEGISRTLPGIKAITGARALLVLGDSVTTDHISPGGAFGPDTDAGQYLLSLGISSQDFNGYIARRGNHDVMVRGTFANIRLRNLMVPDKRGGMTLHWPHGTLMTVYDAACRYQQDKISTVIFAGKEYGTGSSRDWAAKGTSLLGIKAVIAGSFERIHRGNLVGMGVLPLQFQGQDSVQTLGIDGSEIFDIALPSHGLTPRQTVVLTIHRKNGARTQVTLLARVDTPIECLYFAHGGILPYVLRESLNTQSASI